MCGDETVRSITYVGLVNQTIKGVPCQRWDLQYPHSHTQADITFPQGNMSLAESYCRNPDGETTSWCYTIDPNKRWDSCDIVMCREYFQEPMLIIPISVHNWKRKYIYSWGWRYFWRMLFPVWLSAESYSEALDISTSASIAMKPGDAMDWQHCATVTLRGHGVYAAGSCEASAPTRTIKISSKDKTILVFCEVEIVGHLIGEMSLPWYDQ